MSSKSVQKFCRILFEGGPLGKDHFSTPPRRFFAFEKKRTKVAPLGLEWCARLTSCALLLLPRALHLN